MIAEEVMMAEEDVIAEKEERIARKRHQKKQTDAQRALGRAFNDHRDTFIKLYGPIRSESIMSSFGRRYNFDNLAIVLYLFTPEDDKAKGRLSDAGD